MYANFIAEDIEQLAQLFKRLDALCLPTNFTITLEADSTLTDAIIAVIKGPCVNTTRAYLDDDFLHLSLVRNCDICAQSFNPELFEEEECEECTLKLQKDYEEGITQSIEKQGGLL